MKNIVLLLLCGSLLLATAATAQGQAPTAPSNPTVEKQIDSIFHVMVKAGENLDYAMLTSAVDDKHRAGFISNGTYYARYDSLVDVMKSRTQGIAKQTITIQKQKISVLADNIALLSATGEAKVDTNSGNSFVVKFFWSFVYEKTDGKWQVVQSHQSNAR